jgi:alkylation response protein AidB-like acyl-CoA dehydrogenase
MTAMGNMQHLPDDEAFSATAEKCFEQCSGLDPGEIAPRLADAGLLGVMANASAGGLQLGASDALSVIRAAGERLLAYPLAEVIAAAWCVAELSEGRSLPTICWGPQLTVRRNGTMWSASGVAPRVAFGLSADVMLFSTVEGIFSIDLAGKDVSRLPAAELDFERQFGDVVMAAAAVTQVGDPAKATALDSLGAILRSADMLGAASAAFAEACAHTSNRRQFGKPLSALQAVSMSLARDYHTLECARVALVYAAQAWDGAQDDVIDSVAIAAALASGHLPAVAENAIQLHGAMGFTWEMPLHRWLRRIQTASAVLPAAVARRSIAERLIKRSMEAL